MPTGSPGWRENLARLRLPAEIVRADAVAWTPPAPFDAILLDAPCTATGTIRRHPDVAHTKRPRDVQAAAEAQARLLKAAAVMLKPGGRIVFATCSLQPEEGEAHLARAASLGLVHDPFCAADLPGPAGGDHPGRLPADATGCLGRPRAGWTASSPRASAGCLKAKGRRGGGQTRPIREPLSGPRMAFAQGSARGRSDTSDTGASVGATHRLGAKLGAGRTTIPIRALRLGPRISASWDRSQGLGW